MFQKRILSAKEWFKQIAFMVVAISGKKDYIPNGRLFVLIRKENAIMRLELIKHLYKT